MTKLFQFLFQTMTDRTIACSLLIIILCTISGFLYGKELLILFVIILTVPLYIIFLLKPMEQLISKLRKKYYEK
mgnify:CR=1 FL=1